MKLSVDLWPRIEFYVRHGLVQKRPTAEQLEKASKVNLYLGAGVTERLIWYARHPLDLFPTKAKKLDLQMPIQEIAAGGLCRPSGALTIATTSREKGNDNDADTLEPLGDRVLHSVCQFSPARFAIACYFNPCGWGVPWNATRGTGLTIPLKFLISHVLHTPHPFALWDIQIIHADENGLEQLESELNVATTSHRLTYRIYRAMAQRADYYDHLRDLIPRVQRFDYPPTPPGLVSLSYDLVEFLNYATTL